MNIYKKYLTEIQQRRDKGLQPKPIDDRDLLIQIIKQIKNYGKECQKLNKNNAPTPYQFSTDDNY